MYTLRVKQKQYPLDLAHRCRNLFVGAYCWSSRPHNHLCIPRHKYLHRHCCCCHSWHCQHLHQHLHQVQYQVRYWMFRDKPHHSRPTKRWAGGVGCMYLNTAMTQKHYVKNLVIYVERMLILWGCVVSDACVGITYQCDTCICVYFLNGDFVIKKSTSLIQS